MALTLNVDTVIERIQVEDKTWVFGYFTWGASDTYATNGFDAQTPIKNRFGVQRVETMHFGNGISDGAGATFITTGEALARYEESSGKIKLYLVGRNGAPAGTATATARFSEVEIPNAASLNAGRLDFWAICT